MQFLLIVLAKGNEKAIHDFKREMIYIKCDDLEVETKRLWNTSEDYCSQDRDSYWLGMCEL